MKKLSKNLKFLFIAVGVILFWRGLWGLADLYIFPENPPMSFVISILLGLAILLLSHEKLSDLF